MRTLILGGCGEEQGGILAAGSILMSPSALRSLCRWLQTIGGVRQHESREHLQTFWRAFVQGPESLPRHQWARSCPCPEKMKWQGGEAGLQAAPRPGASSEPGITQRALSVGSKTTFLEPRLRERNSRHGHVQELLPAVTCSG